MGAGAALAREALKQLPAPAPRHRRRSSPWASGGPAPADPAAWAAAYADGSFDVLVSGYLLRNSHRPPDPGRWPSRRHVLKPGGRWVSLDTTRPRRSLFSPFIRFHMHSVIPFVGSLLAGRRDAYTYLPESTESLFARRGAARAPRPAAGSLQKW